MVNSLGLLTDHDEWVLCCGPGSDMGLFQVLLGQQGLLQAREQVAVLGGVGQRVGRLLVHLGQALLPQLHHPGGTTGESGDYITATQHSCLRFAGTHTHTVH